MQGVGTAIGMMAKGTAREELVSIVMPAYNAEKFIGEAIRSVLEQTHQAWELLVCDDSSTDKTRHVIEAQDDVRIRKYHNSENLGQVLTKNKLLKESSGDFITFLDADDYMAPDRLESLLRAFRSDPSLGLCGSNVVRDFDGRLVYLAQLPLSYHSILRMGAAAFPAPAAVMIRRNVYRAIGGYREFFNGMCFEDHDWIRRIVERFRAVNVPEHLYFYRYNSNSFGNRKFDSKKLAAGELVEYLTYQRAIQGYDDLDGGNVNAVNRKLNSLLEKYARREWEYYVELRRLTELNNNYRFRIWLNMFVECPNRLITYKALVRALIPVGSNIDRLVISVKAWIKSGSDKR